MLLESESLYVVFLFSVRLAAVVVKENGKVLFDLIPPLNPSGNMMFLV